MSAPADAGARRGSGLAGEALASLWGRVRRVLRIRRSVAAGNVRYTELTAEPLHRALSRHGGGSKEYMAEFRGGGRMRIRCTPSRVYADLARDPRTELGAWLAGVVRPGMRVVLLGAGTGQIGDEVGRLAGPSGAVVCVEQDEESARFAQRRYARPNTAFETGAAGSLAGELDGAFDAAVVIEPAPRDAEDAQPLSGELLRVVAPGGPLVLAVRASDDGGVEGARDADGITAAMAERAGRADSALRLGPAERVGGWFVVTAERAKGPEPA